MTYLKRFLGWLGFNWCQHCGRRLVLVDVRGWEQREIYECPHCDSFDRFDPYPVTKEAKKHMEKVIREKGRP